MKRQGVRTKTGQDSESSRMRKEGRDTSIARGRMGPSMRSSIRMKKGGAATKKKK